MGALNGLKVLELGQFVSAPYCGKLLADMGAEVVKIEPPGLGDKARSWGPFPGDDPHPEKSGLFIFLNGNKRGVTLNLATATGVRLLKELLAQTDILIDGAPPAEMAAMGLDYASLKASFPKLVVTSITPFGQSGPYRDYRGGALIASHTSGQAYINPAEGVNDLASEPPLQAPGHFADLTSGLTAAVATMGAVIGRKASGAGQQVDLSEQEALASTVRTEMAACAAEGELPGRIKVRKRSGGMLYRCKDGYVVISGTGDGFWPGMVRMMGSPAWAASAWCKDNVSRNENIERVNASVETWSVNLTAREVEVAAIAERVPCAPVNSVAALDDNEQLAARGFFIDVDHPVAGRQRQPGTPYRHSATPWKMERPAPLLGQHNAEVYGALGYAKDDLVRLRRLGVI